MNLAAFSIRRPIAVTMLVVGILIIGFVSSSKLPLNLLPDITYPKITIRTEYPQAAPAEVETMVTRPIEQTVGIISNVVRISSVSRPGISEVTVEFTWGSDVDIITMDLREKLQLLEGVFPEEIKKPVLLRYDPSSDPIITLGVAGELSLAELRYTVEREIERELERIEGVAAVKVQGGEEEEIAVKVDEEKLTRYGLTLTSVIDRLRRENINLAGGTLEDAGEELSVRTLNRFQDLDDIRSIVVSTAGAGGLAGAASSLPSGLGASGGISGLGSLLSGLGGLAGLLGPGAALAPGSPAAKAEPQVLAPIRLGDVAEVQRRPKERAEIARLNGKECIKVSVYKEGDANIVTVARAVHQRLAAILENLRAEPASPEWLAGARARNIKKFLNLASNLTLNLEPFLVPEEDIKLINRLQIKVISDQSVFIVQSIISVIQNLIAGAIVACLILYFALRNIGSTIVIGVVIPIALIATLNMMFFQGLSFNIMSLGGLALGVGVLMDNAIIIVENILRHRTFNPDLKSSAINGTQEMAGAITSATLTNIIVFFPIFYVEGIFKQMFGDLAWTVTYSMIAACLVGMTIVPMMSAILGKRVRIPLRFLEDDIEIPPEVRQAFAEEEKETPPAPIWQRPRLGERPAETFGTGAKAPAGRSRLGFWAGALLIYLIWPWKVWYRASARAIHWALHYPLQAFDWIFLGIKRAYPPWLTRSLQHPWITSISVMALAAASTFALSWLDWEMIPPVDQGEFIVHLRFPTGTPLEETNRRIAELETKIRRIPEARYLDDLFATAGIGTSSGEMEIEKGENIGEITVTLSPQRPFKDEEFMALVRRTLSREVDLELSLSKPQLFSFKNPVEIEISGYNMDDLRRSMDEVLARIREVPGLSDLESSLGEANPEVAITVDRDRAAAFNLTAGEITDVIRKKIKGERATRYDRGDRQEDIVVETRLEDRATLADLGNLSISLPAGGSIPLKAVAEIRATRGPGAITRVGNSRVAVIKGSLSQRALGEVVEDIEARLKSYSPPRGIYWRVAGQNEEMKRSLGSMYQALLLAVILVYLVMAAQFESIFYPFVIMFSVPFAVIGLAPFFLVAGITINAFSLIGILMMVGIAVDDATVLVETINIFRRQGMERTPAIMQAASARMRPIIINTWTAQLGVLPMALAFGPGSELRAPMAWALIAGLTTSTIFTLLVIPALYLLFDNLHRFFMPPAAAAPPAEPPAGG